MGEIEYIRNVYCDPPGTRPSSPNIFPSEDRLEAADVYTQNLPKSSLSDIARRLPNQTLLIMGDSVMEQFYNSLQCLMRKERLERRPDAAFLTFIKKNECASTPSNGSWSHLITAHPSIVPCLDWR